MPLSVSSSSYLVGEGEEGARLDGWIDGVLVTILGSVYHPLDFAPPAQTGHYLWFC